MTRRPPVRPTAALADSDATAVHRASRAVGVYITVGSSVLVLGVLIAAFAFVFKHIPPARLFDLNFANETTTIDVGGVDILIAGFVIGSIAIVLAGTLSIFATRRAVRPLAEALRIQRTFVADASHELRTPLAVLDARLQLLQRSLTPSDPSAAIVSDLRHDSKTLVDIVNDLLASAEVGGQENTRPVEVNPIVTLAVNSMRVIAAEKKVTIGIDAGAPVFTVVPSAGIHRCVVALLDNAVDFSPPSSRITVSISVRRGMVRLAVRDQGAGIRGIDPARIFDRFARSDIDGGGRTRTGFGIGLSLVRDTVERAGGRAAVSHTSAEGTEIELLIPLIRADHAGS